MKQWVYEDVRKYIAAATSFQSYKRGEASVSNGERRWDSGEQPLAADNCWVVERKTNVAFLCQLTASAKREESEAQYAQLVEDVTAALPRSWKPDTGAPYPNEVASKAFRSADGFEGEIWLHSDSASGKYQLDFQVVAPAASRPGSVPQIDPNDDPIGPGGNVSPPGASQNH